MTFHSIGAHSPICQLWRSPSLFWKRLPVSLPMIPVVMNSTTPSNFGVCDVSLKETWVIAAEWMQPEGCEKHGSNNAIHVVKIKWNRPNKEQ